MLWHFGNSEPGELNASEHSLHLFPLYPRLHVHLPSWSHWGDFEPNSLHWHLWHLNLPSAVSFVPQKFSEHWLHCVPLYPRWQLHKSPFWLLVHDAVPISLQSQAWHPILPSVHFGTNPDLQPMQMSLVLLQWHSLEKSTLPDLGKGMMMWYSLPMFNPFAIRSHWQFGSAGSHCSLRISWR